MWHSMPHSLADRRSTSDCGVDFPARGCDGAEPEKLADTYGVVPELETLRSTLLAAAQHPARGEGADDAFVTAIGDVHQWPSRQPV